MQTFIRRLREWSKQEFRISPKLRTPLVCLHLKIFREKPEKSEKSKKWKQMQKKTIFDMLRNKLLYHLENLVNFQALKSRREGILQDSHVQNRPSSKPQHQIRTFVKKWRSIRRKLTARNLESPKDDGSHEDKSWGLTQR